MNLNTFSISETVKEAWRLVDGTKATFTAVLLLITIVQAISFLLSLPDLASSWMVGLIQVVKIMATIIYFILVWGLVYLGALRASQQAINYKKVADLFNIGFFFRMVGLYILQTLVMLPAFLILALPAILRIQEDQSLAFYLVLICSIIGIILILYLAMRLYLAKIMVIQSGMSPWTAIKQSFHYTRNHAWQLFKLTILNMLIFFVSAIPLGIGLIWTVPYYFINYGVVYNKLTAGKAN